MFGGRRCAALTRGLKMNQVEINKIIYTALKQYENGSTKIEVYKKYEDLIDKKILAHQLAIVPDRILSKKYHLVNLIYGIYLIFIFFINITFFLIKLINTGYTINYLLLSLMVLLFGIMEIYLVFKKNALIYRILIISGLILFIFGLYLSSNNFLQFLILSIPSILIILGSLFLGIKIFPYFGIYKCKTDSHGYLRYTTEL